MSRSALSVKHTSKCSDPPNETLKTADCHSSQPFFLWDQAQLFLPGDSRKPPTLFKAQKTGNSFKKTQGFKTAKFSAFFQRSLSIFRHFPSVPQTFIELSGFLRVFSELSSRFPGFHGSPVLYEFPPSPPGVHPSFRTSELPSFSRVPRAHPSLPVHSHSTSENSADRSLKSGRFVSCRTRNGRYRRGRMFCRKNRRVPH